MAFVHSKSQSVDKSELDLFSIPPTQTAIDGCRWECYRPIASLKDQVPIEFHIAGNGSDFIDLAHTMLYVKASITKSNGDSLDVKDVTAGADGKKADKSSDVGPINNWMHSLFSDVEVSLNHSKVSASVNHYAYRSYFENLLSYGPAAKRSHLTQALFYKDTAGHMESRKDNKGFQSRSKFTEGSAEVEMHGPLYCDIFNVDRYLLNEVSLRIKLLRTENAFNLMGSSNDYKVKIHDCFVRVRKVIISPSKLLSIHNDLKDATAKYPITKVEVRNITMSPNISSKVMGNIFLGDQPKRVVFGFVENTSFHGDIKSNPFNFTNANISRISVFSGGEQVPTVPLEPNFSKDGQTILSYNTLFAGSGTHFENDGNDLDRSEYNKGYSLWCFDLTPDLSAGRGTHWCPVKQGNFKIVVNFAEEIKKALTCIIYAEFDSMIQIDLQRNVIVEK